MIEKDNEALEACMFHIMELQTQFSILVIAMERADLLTVKDIEDCKGLVYKGLKESWEKNDQN